MLKSTTLASLIAAPALAQGEGLNQHPVRYDRTEIHWQTPFEAAQTKA